MHKTKIAMLVSFVCLAGAQPAFAANNARGSAEVRLTVPVYCELADAQIEATPQTGVVTGSVQEFCNSANGFEVVISHRTLEAEESAALVYGERTVQLSPTGYSPVAWRRGPRIKLVNFALETQKLAKPIVLSLSVTPA